MKFKLEVDVELDDELVSDMESELFRHGYIDYWGYAERVEGVLTVVDAEGCDDLRDPEQLAKHTHTLGADWIPKGLKVLAERDPVYRRLNELLEGEYDGDSLDCLVQASIFGDILYG